MRGKIPFLFALIFAKNFSSPKFGLLKVINAREIYVQRKNEEKIHNRWVHCSVALPVYPGIPKWPNDNLWDRSLAMVSIFA